MSSRARLAASLSPTARAGLLAATVAACISLERPQSLDGLPTADGGEDASRADVFDAPAADAPESDAETLDAPAPSDVLDARDASDVLDARDASDVLDARDASDVLDARDASDVLDARDASDVLDADVLDARDTDALDASDDRDDGQDVIDGDFAEGGDAGGDADGATCASGQTRCVDRCVNLNSDTANCGVCGQSCERPNSFVRCRLGICSITLCQPGFGNCDDDTVNGCEVRLDSDVAHCGATTATLHDVPLGCTHTVPSEHTRGTWDGRCGGA
jgi:hypothetical protein